MAVDGGRLPMPRYIHTANNASKHEEQECEAHSKAQWEATKFLGACLHLNDRTGSRYVLWIHDMLGKRCSPGWDYTLHTNDMHNHAKLNIGKNHRSGDLKKRRATRALITFGAYA